jgi:hypothetical protein
MDILNDYIYPEESEYLNDTDDPEYKEYLETLNRPLDFDDWCCLHSDDLWYLWVRIREMTQVYANIRILDTMSYAEFCSMCYENSSGY